MSTKTPQTKLVLEKPKVSKKPTKPLAHAVPATIDKEFVAFQAETSDERGKTVGLIKALEDLPTDVDLKTVKMHLELADDDDYVAKVKLFSRTTVPNPDWAPAQKAYEEALADFKAKEEEWKGADEGTHKLRSSLYDAVVGYQALFGKTDRSRSQGAQMGRYKIKIKKLCPLLGISQPPEMLEARL